MRLIGTILLLCVSLNGYATCSNGTPENMSHYAYMTEDELNREYCYCGEVAEIGRNHSREMGSMGLTGDALKALDEVDIMIGERTKIKRVLKKDYNTEPKEC